MGGKDAHYWACSTTSTSRKPDHYARSAWTAALGAGPGAAGVEVPQGRDLRGAPTVVGLQREVRSLFCSMNPSALPVGGTLPGQQAELSRLLGTGLLWPIQAAFPQSGAPSHQAHPTHSSQQPAAPSSLLPSCPTSPASEGLQSRLAPTLLPTAGTVFFLPRARLGPPA